MSSEASTNEREYLEGILQRKEKLSTVPKRSFEVELEGFIWWMRHSHPVPPVRRS